MDMDIIENDQFLEKIDSTLGKTNVIAVAMECLRRFSFAFGLELWKTKNLDDLIKANFDQLKKKIKTRIDSLIEYLRKLESNYMNEINNFEVDYKNAIQLPSSYIGRFNINSNSYESIRIVNILNNISTRMIKNDYDYEQINFRLNTNNLFKKPQIICRSNNRYSGALLIPEIKYRKFITNNNFDYEFGLFSVTNKNCLKLICFPEGRIIRTYSRFVSANKSVSDETLKEPRGLCWNHDKSLIFLCDSGNSRLVVLKPKFDKTAHSFTLDFEYVSSFSDLPTRDITNRNILLEVNKAKSIQYPAFVCVNTASEDGEVFLCDTFNSRIIGLNKDLNKIERIFSNGLKNPFSLCVWRDKLIVADTYNNRVLMLALSDGTCEMVIPVNKGEEREEQSEKSDEDNDDSLDERIAKKKRFRSSSSLSTTSESSSDTSSTSSDEDLSSNTSTKFVKDLKLYGNFRRPYGLYVDGNDRLFILDWFDTDTGSSHEESIRLSGRIQVYDLENQCQLLSYSVGSYKLHLPNTLLGLRNGDFIVCNVRHLTYFAANPIKPYYRHEKLKLNNYRNYSDDDDDDLK